MDTIWLVYLFTFFSIQLVPVRLQSWNEQASPSPKTDDESRQLINWNVFSFLLKWTALKIHKTTAHPSAVFQCDQCDRSFLSRSALLMHQPVHSTKLNFQCRYCQAKMRTLKERYVHERIHTADETPYQCSHCEKQFNTLVNLRSHLKLHANGTADNTNNTTIWQISTRRAIQLS